MMYKRSLAGMAFFLLLILAPALCAAEIFLEAPDKAARGDAFVARASADAPVNDFVFFWRGKSYKIRAAEQAVNGKTAWIAEILLPAPLDEKAPKLKLGLGVSTANKRPIASVHADVALYDRKRPVQKLTVDKKYVNPPASEKARIQRDREKVAKALSAPLEGRLWSLPLQRPVPGGISSSFGMKRVFNGQPRSVHRGLDLRGATGTPIKACADGKVILVDNLYFSGNTVYIDHGDGVRTAYLHMSEPKVQVGQYVKKGDLVGLVGATGRVTGPHLHLSLIVQGQSADPEPLLEKNSQSGKQK